MRPFWPALAFEATPAYPYSENHPVRPCPKGRPSMASPKKTTTAYPRPHYFSVEFSHGPFEPHGDLVRRDGITRSRHIPSGRQTSPRAPRSTQLLRPPRRAHRSDPRCCSTPCTRIPPHATTRYTPRPEHPFTVVDMSTQTFSRNLTRRPSHLKTPLVTPKGNRESRRYRPPTKEHAWQGQTAGLRSDTTLRDSGV